MKVDKLQALNLFKEDKAILLTDYRGYRGLEIDQCILIIDPNEEIGNCIYMEMLTRAINQLDLIILPLKEEKPKNRESTFHSTLLNIFKLWIKNNLVEVSKPETILLEEEKATEKVTYSQEGDIKVFTEMMRNSSPMVDISKEFRFVFYIICC